MSEKRSLRIIMNQLFYPNYFTPKILKIHICLKAPIHDATLLHANVACNKVASCMLKFHATKVACNIFAFNMLHRVS